MQRYGSLSGLLIFSPIKIGQFQCPSPTELVQFRRPLVGALLLGGVHGVLLGNSHNVTLSISAPRTVTEITRLSVGPGVREVAEWRPHSGHLPLALGRPGQILSRFWPIAGILQRVAREMDAGKRKPRQPKPRGGAS